MTQMLPMPGVQSLSETKQRLLAKYLRAETAPRSASSDGITSRPRGEPVPLSLSQEQLFLRETGIPDIPPLYNECVTLRMAGPLNITILERSLHEIIRRHEPWRTSYDVQKGQPVQIIHPAPAEFFLPVLDLRGLASTRQEKEIGRLIGELVQRPFDVKQAPLLRVQLVRLSDFEQRLYLIAHLSVVDGVSVYQIFPEELAALYYAYLSGQPSALTNLPVTFGDYAYWQRQTVEGEAVERQLVYWRKQLRGELPVLDWPNDCARPARQTFRGKIQSLTLPSTLADEVKRLSKREGVTLFMTLLASFVTLLHGYTGQKDIIVGTPSPGGRKRSEVQKLLGYFLTPVPLRFDLTANPTFCELLRQAQRLTVEAISNDGIPVEVLSERLNVKPDLSRTPLFSVAISLQPPMPQLGLDWSVTSMDIGSGGSPWEFYMAFIDQPGAMMARVQYNPDIFEAATINRMWRDFERLLGRVTTNASSRLSDLESSRAESAKASAGEPQQNATETLQNA
ncbi:MAG: hypothetical protein DMG60_02050 [Acidobacteria bacterium]|nr:MAG: hypothetical protein DMG60_02050 [Acidobacteriota bacterium]